MKISHLVKIVGTVAFLGFIGQVQAHTCDPLDTTCIPDAVGVDPLLSLSTNVAAGTISGGMGVNYVGRFVYDDKMAKVDFKKTFPIELSVANATDGFPGFAADSTTTEVISIAPTTSTGWNDSTSNPNLTDAQKLTATIEKDGFGSSSNWYLLDLSKLAAGNYYVSVTVERYDDGVEKEYSAPVVNVNGTVTPAKLLPSDDDLVPALSVFYGYQNRGASLSWFPNKFQSTTTPFWAEMLKPANDPQVTKSKITYGLVGMHDVANLGFDTAYTPIAGADNDIAQVSGVIKLAAPNKDFRKDFTTNRYLTIALGGDDRIANAKHDANYKITVKVHKK